MGRRKESKIFIKQIFLKPIKSVMKAGSQAGFGAGFSGRFIQNLAGPFVINIDPDVDSQTSKSK